MTPYAFDNYAAYPDVYKFSDGSQIGQVAAGTGNSSNYRFFEIQPIKWIVLNYNFLPSQYGTGGNGTHTRLELLANGVLMSGIAPNNIIWENSTINTYLNGTFNKEAFPKTLLTDSTIFNNTNEADSNLIETGSNSNYLQGGSNSTTQSLYLLSQYEMANSSSPYITNGIFGTSNTPDDDKRTANATDYAKGHNQALNLTTGKANQWLRSNNGVTTYYVATNGGIGNNNQANYASIGTRPAMHKKSATP